jgi:hypothetical protein
VEYNPELSPIPHTEMVEAIKYALWSLTSRVDLEAEYVGLTGNAKTMDRITIQWGDLPQPMFWGELYGWTEWHFYDINGPDVMVRIILDRTLAKLDWEKAGNKFGACLRETLHHELFHAFQGHILGDPGRADKGHSTNPDDMMYGDRGTCRYTASPTDLAMLGKPLKPCYVELTPDLGLYLPDMRAGLVYRGAIGGYQTWDVASYTPGLSQCARIENGRIILSDIRTMGKRYSRAVLEPWNGRYRLVELK